MKPEMKKSSWRRWALLIAASTLGLFSQLLVSRKDTFTAFDGAIKLSVTSDDCDLSDAILLLESLIAEADSTPRMVLSDQTVAKERKDAYLELVLSKPRTSKKKVGANTFEYVRLFLPLGPRWQAKSAYIYFGNPKYMTGKVVIAHVDSAKLSKLVAGYKLPVPKVLKPEHDSSH